MSFSYLPAQLAGVNVDTLDFWGCIPLSGYSWYSKGEVELEFLLEILRRVWQHFQQLQCLSQIGDCFMMSREHSQPLSLNTARSSDNPALAQSALRELQLFLLLDSHTLFLPTDQSAGATADAVLRLSLRTIHFGGGCG
jgi:hypothetical protein